MSFDKNEETVNKILPFDSSLQLVSSFLSVGTAFSMFSVQFLEHFVMMYRHRYQEATYLHCPREPQHLRKHIV